MHGLSQSADAAGKYPAQDWGNARFEFRHPTFLDIATPALDPKTLFGETPMVGNEFLVRHAISVQKNQILASGCGHGLIQKFGFSKAFMGTPERATGGPCPSPPTC